MHKGFALVTGCVLAVAVQTFIAIAETWSFGPSLKPLNALLGPFVWPVVTSVSVGAPIALAYFVAATLMKLRDGLALALLIAPFAGMQCVNLVGNFSNVYALYYAAAFVTMALTGALLQARFQSRVKASV